MMRLNQSRIMKLSSRNRILFMRLSLVCCSLSCATLTVGCSTNRWLNTAEWLKYHVRNDSNDSNTPEYMLPPLFKNATMGPWVFCYEEPAQPFVCRKIDHFFPEESADTTMSVEIGVRKVVLVLVTSMGFVYAAFLMTIICNVKSASSMWTLATGISHIFAGMTVLLSLVMYVANVTREVGKKLWPESTLDKPLFYYNYGYSFYTVVVAYVCTQVSAFLVLSVYMAKHDEQMYNRYQIRALLRSNMLASFGGVGLNVVPNVKRMSGAKPTQSRFNRGANAHRKSGGDTFSFSSASGGASAPRSPNDRNSAKNSTAFMGLTDPKIRKASMNRQPPPPYEKTRPLMVTEENDDEENDRTYASASMPYSSSQLSTCPLLPQLSPVRKTSAVAFAVPVATTAL